MTTIQPNIDEIDFVELARHIGKSCFSDERKRLKTVGKRFNTMNGRIRMACIILSRAANLPTAEVKLVFAIVEQAIADLDYKEPKSTLNETVVRAGALRFIMSEGCRRLLDGCGIDHQCFYDTLYKFKLIKRRPVLGITR